MHQLFVQLSRLAEDFIIYNSDAFALISFNDNMLTGSSIMPQKKNPDPAELIRGKVGVSYGKLNSLLTIMKGLPMSYFKDLQDDKEIVFDGYDTLKDTLTMSAELINAVKPIKTNMLEMANKGYTTATDFADYLVKEKHLSFRESYAISAKLVNFAEKNKKKLSELSLDEVKKVYKELDKKVLKIFVFLMYDRISILQTTILFLLHSVFFFDCWFKKKMGIEGRGLICKIGLVSF